MHSTDSTNPKFSSGNIFLIGMMGAGKTTVGKLLAKNLNKLFIDSDEEIQHRTGVTISHIFDVEGESGFRLRESNIIHDLVQRKDIVMATGGGAIIDSGNRELLYNHGIVVYLKSTVGDLWLRTKNDRNRPLLQTENPRAKLKELYDQRDVLYSEIADLTIKTGKQSVQHLVSLLQYQLAELNQSHELIPKP